MIYRIRNTITQEIVENNDFFMDRKGDLFYCRNGVGRIYKHLEAEFFSGLLDINKIPIYEGDRFIIREYTDRGDGTYDDEIGYIIYLNKRFQASFQYSHEELNFLLDIYDIEVIDDCVGQRGMNND